jgi:Protein of unknown function (DUF3551)
MTKLWVSVVVAGMLVLAGATELAQAQQPKPSRWCFKSPEGETDCSYHTLAQCKASRPLNAACYRGRNPFRPGSRS